MVEETTSQENIDAEDQPIETTPTNPVEGQLSADGKKMFLLSLIGKKQII